MRLASSLIAIALLVACTPNDAPENGQAASSETSPELPTIAPECTADQSGFAQLAGRYEIVGARMASSVASIAPAPLSAEDSPIGQVVVFDPRGVQIAGMGCDCWRTEKVTVPGDMQADPMLRDLRLPALDDADISRGDARLDRAYSLSCEGEHFALAYQTGPRVMALTWNNSSSYLVLEKPLSTTQIEAFQRELKSMKFYDGEITGVLDEATLQGARVYYGYRLRDDQAAIPGRIAITANLLDGLGVLED